MPCTASQQCQPVLLSLSLSLSLRPDQPAAFASWSPTLPLPLLLPVAPHRTVQLHDLCVCGPAPIAPGLDPRPYSIRSASIPGLVNYFVSSLGITAPLCRVRSLRAWPALGPPLRLMPSGPSNPRSASTPKSGSSPAGAHGPTAISTGSDGQDEPGSPNRVSWNHLRQGESHQRVSLFYLLPSFPFHIRPLSRDLIGPTRRLYLNNTNLTSSSRGQLHPRHVNAVIPLSDILIP